MVLSDIRGWAEIEVVAGRDLVATVRESDHGTCSVDVPAMRPGEQREIELAIPTSDDVEFHGQVFDAADRKPIEGAIVKLEARSVGPLSKPPAVQIVRSDSLGRFRLSAASWRENSIFVSADGYGPVTLRLGQGHESADVPLEVGLPQAAKIVVRVTGPNGTPVSDALVVAWTESDALMLQQGVSDWSVSSQFTRSAKTGTDGRCEIVALPAGAFLAIRAEHAAYPPQALPASLLLAAGETREVDVCLGTGVRVTGRIIDQFSWPAAYARVWMSPSTKPNDHLFRPVREFAEHHRIVETTTDKDGFFSFPLVAPGSWWIGPAPPPYGVLAALDPKAIAPVGELVALEVNERERDLFIRRDRGLYLSGRVLDASQAAVAKANVAAYPLFPIDALVSDQTDQDGAFVLGPIPAGDWRVLAFKGDGWDESSAVQASAGTTEIVLELGADATIRGRVLGLRSTGVADTDLMISRRAEGTASETIVRDDGSFEFTNLAPGLYDIAARTRDGLAGVCAGIDVHRGAEVEGVEIRVSRGAKLTVRLGNAARMRWIRVVQDGVTVAWAWLEDRSDAVITVPAGILQVELLAPGPEFDIARPASSRTLTLAAGDNGSVDFSADH